MTNKETIREKFGKWMETEFISNDCSMTIADWWLNVRDEELKELAEEINKNLTGSCSHHTPMRLDDSCEMCRESEIINKTVSYFKEIINNKMK